jgi:hypothetical protein
VFTFGVDRVLVLVPFGEYDVGYEAVVSGVDCLFFFLALVAFAGSHGGDADLASPQLYL